MAADDTDLLQESFLDRLRDMSIEHTIMACCAKLTLTEIAHCLEIGKHNSLPLDYVFEKMAVFKETTAHLLYKEDFSLA